MQRSAKVAPRSTEPSRFLLRSLTRHRALSSPPVGAGLYPFEHPPAGISTRSYTTGLGMSPCRPCPCRPIPGCFRALDWVEEGSCTPQRPASAAPAQLRARGFGGDCCEGWRPSQLSLDWRSKPLRYTNSLRFQNEGKTNFSCSCVGKLPTIGQCRFCISPIWAVGFQVSRHFPRNGAARPVLRLGVNSPGGSLSQAVLG